MIVLETFTFLYLLAEGFLAFARLMPGKRWLRGVPDLWRGALPWEPRDA
jgi:hypothetical protein